MSDVGNSFRVPIYLTALTRDELVRLMLQNNLNNQKEHRYFDISFDGSSWVAWFYSVIQIKPAPTRTPKVRAK
jgi:hypothetical protein